tara:strand:+ start:1089 stop:2267 length:1179 start_codon:yes stop_codon:yes gene_type:complete
MAENKKEEPIEKAPEQPTVDETVEKLKVKKPKKKKFEETPEVVKVDLNDLKQKAEEIVKVDLKQPVEEIKVPEETKPTEEAKPVEDTPVIEEVTDTVEEVAEIVEEKIIESIETNTELPENVQKLMSFMEETGGDLNDYVKLNKDYSEMDNHTLLKEYYNTTKPHLKSEEIDFIMEDKFSYDEEADEEKEIKRKKLALKEQVAEAKQHLESVKSKYYEDIKMGSKLTKEQQDAINFFNRYNKESEESRKAQQQAKKTFLNKTENVFNDNFKGFEYEVGEKRYRFNVKNADSVKETQSDINNFVKKFLNKNNEIEDARGYHKALYTAMNSDAIANHFYEQGRADALKESVAKSKNIDMDPRQSHGEVIDNSGLKFKVLGESSNDFKFKIKRKK